MFSYIKNIFAVSKEDQDVDESENQRWIMIKENTFFRDDANLVIIDELAESIESQNLGELDGHSSGAHQFEINFYDVHNYSECKKVVVEYFAKKHPDLEYTISQDYETTYEVL